MPARSGRTFLGRHQVKSVTVRHAPALTAQEIAAHSGHTAGQP
jgi:hypothetical protein